MTSSPKNTRIWLIIGTAFVAFIAMAQYLRPPPATEQSRTLATCIAENHSLAVLLAEMEQADMAIPEQTVTLRSTIAALDRMAVDASGDPQFQKVIAQETARAEASRQRDGTRDPYAFAAREIDILSACAEQASD